MKRVRLKDLADNAAGHFLAGIVPGRYLCGGGLSFKKPGVRTHSGDGPAGTDLHVHDDCEVFVILQGKAIMEVEGKRHELTTGDVFVVEPGEDHHLTSNTEDPCINLWLHTGAERHSDQRP
jgi:mannose-6-phosphate isomerase-like protein (cupin superfamily)